jgi:hypothetical protein
MKTMMKVLLAAGVASTLLAQTDDVLRAQKKAAAAAAGAAADQGKANVMFNAQTFAFVSSQLVSGPPVKGAPYSAESVNETIQTLADGNRIVQRTSSMQYRDSEGRERREETSSMGAIFITDPVAGTRFTLHPDSRTAEKGPVPAVFSTTSVPGVPGERGDRRGPETLSVAIAGAAPAQQGFFYVNSGSITKFSNPGDSKTEQLGNMYIEGVQAQGTRTTITIPAGDIGNDRPINIVDEQWYSPDLQMTIMTKHSDPRTGETNFALKNINRSAPPPTLFEVPADYSVKTGPMGQSFHIEKRE